MSYRETFSEELAAHHLALRNALDDDDMKNRLESYGYDAAKIGELRELCGETGKLYEDREIKKADKLAATDIYHAKHIEARGVYKKLRKLAKLIFEGRRDVYSKLELDGMERTYVEAQMQMKRFYNAVLSDPEILEGFARGKRTEDEFRKGLKLVEEAEKARAERELLNGEKDGLSEDFKKRRLKMREEMSKFWGIAKLATEDEPQLLEILGRTVKADDAPRKSKDRQKSPEDADAEEEEPEAEAETEDES